MLRGDRLRSVAETWGPLAGQLLFWVLLLAILTLALALPGCVTGEDRAEAQKSAQQLEREAREAERSLSLGQIDKAEFETLLAAALERHERRLEDVRARVGERTGSFVEHLTDPSAWLRDLLAVGGGAIVLNKHRSRSREKQLAELRDELAQAGEGGSPAAGPRRAT